MSAPEAGDDVIEYPEIVMSQLTFFEGGLRQLNVMLLHKHRLSSGMHLGWPG